MLNIQQLLTVRGLLDAIKQHHKHLHSDYNFPPLSGMKPVHKFAELFGFTSAEPFVAQLQTMHDRMLSNTMVNLARFGTAEIIHVEIERGREDWENQIRCFLRNGHAFIMTSIDPAKLEPAVVYYHNSCSATVFLGLYAVHLDMGFNGIRVGVYESAVTLTPADHQNEPSKNPKYTLVDQNNIDHTTQTNPQSFTRESEPLSSTSIIATVSSDDAGVNIEFDATPYFENALATKTLATIFKELIDCNFSNDLATDSIAYFFAETETKRLFGYIHSVDDPGSIGFQCSVNREHVEQWFSDVLELRPDAVSDELFALWSQRAR